MIYRTRIKYTAEKKTELWDRWQCGDSLNAIGRAFDRPSSSIFGQLAPSGGIRPESDIKSALSILGESLNKSSPAKAVIQ